VRPFEANDLLILNDSTQCELMSFSIQKHTISTEFRSGDVLLDVKIYSGKWYGTYFENGNNVKTIRKPRKGAKESRDIVAKLAWIYLMQLKHIKRVFRNSYRKHKGYPCDIFHDNNELVEFHNLKAFYKCMNIAKSMLGASNE